MKWIKRLSVLLAGLLACAVILVGIAFILDEDDYKQLLAWGAERFLNSQLTIDGPIRVDISDSLSLISGDIQLKANDDSYRLSIEKLNTSFRIGSYIQTGTFWFNSLELTNVRIEVMETPRDERNRNDWLIPPIVLGQAQVNNLVITFKELPPGTLHTLSLTELTLGELGEHQPLSWRATGLFEEQSFVLNGTIAPLAELIKGENPQKLELELSSASINAHIRGTIADPINGHGLNLQVRYDIPQVRDIIEVFADDTPQLGSLKGSLRVVGDYAAPRLEDIDLHIRQNTAVELAVRGSITNALTGDGLDLQVDGQSTSPEVLSWLLFTKHERVNSIEISGRVKKDATTFSLHDVAAAAQTTEGLKLQLNGNTVIHPTGHQLTPLDVGLTMQFSSPSLNAVNLIGLAEIPDLGPVRGSVALALGMDAVGGYQTDIYIGSSNSSRIILNGDVGYVRIKENPFLSGLKLKTDIKTNEVAHFAEQFGFTLPEMGHGQITGKLETRNDGMMLGSAKLTVGPVDQPFIRANVLLTAESKNVSAINLELDVAVADMIEKLNGKSPGYLGHLHGDARILNQAGQWGLKRINLASSQTSLYQLKLSGGYDAPVNYAEARVKASLSIDNPEKFGEKFALNLSGVKPFRMEGLLIAEKEGFHYQGETMLGSTNTTMKISAHLQNGKPVVSANIDVPVLHLEDFGVGVMARDIATKKPEKEPNDYVFSRDELNIEFLNYFDLNLALSIDEVESGGRLIDSVKGKIRLKDGQLSIDPLSLVYEGGNTEIEMDLLATAIPEYQLTITSDDVSLGSLMAQIQGQVPIRGYSDMYLDLHTKGRSMHEMASGLTGSVVVGLERVRIPRNYIEFLSVDALGWVLSKTSRKEKYLNLNCLVVALNVKEGDVRSETLSADGSRLSVSGQLNMNLEKETLDILLIPKQKKRVFSSISPVKVKGPMRAPVITAIPAKAALQEVAAMALLPGVFVPLRMGEKLWSLMGGGSKVRGGCAKLR